MKSTKALRLTYTSRRNLILDSGTLGLEDQFQPAPPSKNARKSSAKTLQITEEALSLLENFAISILAPGQALLALRLENEIRLRLMTNP